MVSRAALILLIAALCSTEALAIELGAFSNTRWNNGWSLDTTQFANTRTKLTSATDSVDGWSVTIGYETALSASTLQQYDAFWVGWVDDPPHPSGLTDADLAVLTAYMNTGGIVFVGCDDPGHDRLCANFGTHAIATAPATFAPSTAGLVHPIFTGPYGNVRAYLSSGAVSQFSPISSTANVLALDPTGVPVFAIQPVGAGKLVMSADVDVFGAIISTGPGFTGSDNDRLLGNLFAWIDNTLPTVPVCGNGTEEAGEECDDGNTANTDACLSDCTDATCGDGYTWDTVEDCDDANASNTDACTNLCELAACHDGYTQGSEECDDGNTDDTDDCVGECRTATCGDGYLQTGLEECDDGNAFDNDECPTTCLDAVCGDGHLFSLFEACDDGDNDDNDACLNNCTDATCGDGLLWVGVEQCDDGNSNDDDSCLGTCEIAGCGDGVVSGTEDCDDSGESASCNFDCTTATCGDGTTNASAGEDCDDYGLSVDCDADCSWAQCGDGIRNALAGEECDDGGIVPGDGCDESCLIEEENVAADADMDGLSDAEEVATGTDPFNPDSDGDGSWDGADLEPHDNGADGVGEPSNAVPDYGLGCSTSGGGGTGWMLLAVVLLRRRRA